MLITTTASIEGKQITEYKGLVFGEIVVGANIIRDFFAGITDIIGGRSGAYESKLNTARREALKELEKEAQKIGANAVVGVSFDYQTLGTKDMFVVAVTGTAVIVR